MLFETLHLLITLVQAPFRVYFIDTALKKEIALQNIVGYIRSNKRGTHIIKRKNYINTSAHCK